MRIKNYLAIAAWIVVFQGLGFLLGFLTKNNLPLWYNGLVKSGLTPPSIVFSIVWSLLYIFLAVVGWRIWERQKKHPNHESKITWYLYTVQMMVNWLWTPIFFQFHLIGLGLGFLFLLIGLNSSLIFKLMKKHPIESLCFIPYLLWLVFATYLNAVIYWWN
ncbi:TspO/MBR family protein [Legionella sp. km772]|uniref:TspO/MBR family protein n=1 Tax=Legionella sp. km772 TaxID=2498111 RepID=UPI001315149D|nr:TspO/MBR family protein [Legionella sp. km772]